jgi:hypothetical protein
MLGRSVASSMSIYRCVPFMQRATSSGRSASPQSQSRRGIYIYINICWVSSKFTGVLIFFTSTSERMRYRHTHQNCHCTLVLYEFSNRYTSWLQKNRWTELLLSTMGKLLNILLQNTIVTIVYEIIILTI